MPIDKYVIIRRAAEINEVECRLQLISDVATAFSGNNEHIKHLQKLHTTLSGYHAIKWEKDPDWKERLARFQR